jgi:hypothetical protein
MVANDIGHFTFMEPVDIGLYLATVAPLYAWIPLATVMVFGRLKARLASATEA